jgi:hypothetical protein
MPASRALPWLVVAALAAATLVAVVPAAAQDATLPGMARFVAQAPGGRPVVFWHAPADSAIAHVWAETAADFAPAPVVALDLPPDTFTVVVAPSERAFVDLTGGRVPDWGLAVAFPQLRRVVVRSPRLTGRVPVDPATVLRHELGHLYLAASVGSEEALPRWFHEGFAALYADEWRWVAPVRLAWARVTRRLDPLESLADTFPGAGDPGLAYVHSMAAVRDLRDRGGDAGLARLLARVRSGASFDRAMRETFGLTLAQFYSSWSEELGQSYGWLVALTDERGLWVGLALLVVALWIIRRRAIRREIERRRAIEDATLGSPDDHALGVEEQDRYWEHEDEESWRGDRWQDDEGEDTFVR